MHPTSPIDLVFPLSQGSSERPALRPPRSALAPEIPLAAVAAELSPPRPWTMRRAANLFTRPLGIET